MTDKTQPEALALADEVRQPMAPDVFNLWAAEAAGMIRRQHARIAELEAKLEAVGAGGVQALSAAPEAIAKLRHLYKNLMCNGVRDTEDAKRIAQGLLAPAIEALERATPPAEQQATTEAVTPKAGATTGAALGGVYAELPRAGAIGYASVVDVDSYVTRMTIGPRLPGVRDIALWTTDQLRDFADRTHALRMEQAATKAAPVVWLSSKQLRGVTALHGQYLPFRRQPEGRFDTPVYLVEAAPKAAPAEGGDETDWYHGITEKHFDRAVQKAVQRDRASRAATPKAAPGEPDYSEKWDAELGRTAMRFVDRAGDVHPGIDDAETICAEFHQAMSEVIERMPHVQRMAAPQQEARHLTQALTDPENQPNQYGVEFGMSGQQMYFKIGNQLFRLAYEPDDQQEFEFMKRMLIHAFSTFTPDVKAAPGEQNAVSAEWLEQAYREGWAACRDAETIGEEAEDWAFGNSTANSRMIDAQQAAPQQEAQEPVAWESTTPGYIKYITQARYEKFSPAVRRWYKPYRCSGCAERGAGFDACDMATAAAQGFRSGQAAAKQEK